MNTWSITSPNQLVWLNTNWFIILKDIRNRYLIKKKRKKKSWFIKRRLQNFVFGWNKSLASKDGSKVASGFGNGSYSGLPGIQGCNQTLVAPPSPVIYLTAAFHESRLTCTWISFQTCEVQEEDLETKSVWFSIFYWRDFWSKTVFLFVEGDQADLESIALFELQDFFFLKFDLKKNFFYIDDI